MLATRKAQELDVVELTEDLPEFGLKKGELGTVVVAFDKPDEAYDLEFVNESGKSRFAYAVKPNQIRSAGEAAKEALERGINFQTEGKGVEAEKEYRRAIELAPSLIEELHNHILKSFELQGNFGEINTFEKVVIAMRLILRLNPNYEVARNNLAIAFENWGILEANKGDLYAAINRFRNALAIARSPEVDAHIRSNFATAWTQLGIQAYQKGEHVGLPNYMGLAHEIAPTDQTKRNLTMAYASVALWCFDQNQLGASREYLQLAYDISGVAPEDYVSLLRNPNFLKTAIMNFLDKGTPEFSVDTQTKQVEAHLPSMEQQEYMTAA